MRQNFISLPILVVYSVILFLYYTTVFVIIDEWLGLNTSPGFMNALIFTGFAFMCIVNYTIAIVRDPGNVPASFVPDVEDPETPIHEIKRKGGDLRYCQKCSHYKPPRAHHCRVCRRCVLRMDHHCVWINNCVGHANYKVFFVFVLYAVIACIYSMVLLVGSAAYDVHKDELQSGDSFKTSYYHEGVRAMWLAEKVGNIYHHPYDLGVYENLVSVLGPNIFSWICPMSNHIGSGLRFRTFYDDALWATPRQIPP
ncbi:putative protein S-acyltransferase 16 isoform X2 [Tasmannia lanceolata]|uniref:putative protein S-acyltransferase 16 isoform X2 n=1 Tax=Tasmannia lanceolata TaxID=3420 RepID=UPI004063A2E5